MYDEMVRLGIGEYNTNFLVAGVDCVQAMLALQDEELAELGIASPAERRRVLQLLQSVAAPTSPQAPPRDLPASSQQLQQPKHDSQEHPLVRAGLEAELKTVSMERDRAVSVAEARLQERHDAELAALRAQSDHELQAVRGELAAHKGLADEKAAESAKCVQRLQAELEQEQEHGRDRLRAELDQFMFQVGRLTEENKRLAAELAQAREERAAMSAEHLALQQLSSTHKQLQQELQEAQGTTQSLQGQLAQKEAYLEDFRAEMSAQIAASRKAAREAEAQAAACLAGVEMERSEARGKLAELQGRLDRSAGRVEATLARQREEHSQAQQELQNQLLSAVADLAPVPVQVEGEAAQEPMLCLPLSEMLAVIEQLMAPEQPPEPPEAPEPPGEPEGEPEGLGAGGGYVDKIYNAMELLNPFGLD